MISSAAAELCFNWDGAAQAGAAAAAAVAAAVGLHGGRLRLVIHVRGQCDVGICVSFVWYVY